MLTAKQAEVVTATGSVAVTAGAGSGKTFLLTERYVHLVTQGLSPLEVVATTFTRKAAAELKSRIRTRMQGAALSPEVQAELEAAQISTMDALAARICHDFPLEANVPADFTVMDEQEAILFKARYFEEAMAQVPQVCFAHMPYSVLRDVLEALMFDPIAAQEALAKDASDWEAYAEQVREETRQSVLEQIAPHKDTLQGLRGPTGDAREDARVLALKCVQQIEARDASGFDAILNVSLRGGSKKTWGEDAFKEAGVAISGVRDTIKKHYKQLTLTLGEADALLQTRLPAIRTAFEVVRDYLAAQRFKARGVDFANLEVHALKALECAHVRAHYRARWKAFLIDELQDTNPVQARLLGLLAEGASLTVVGDAKQSIYGFRRADVNVFFRFRDEILERSGRVVTLDTSFRTHVKLLDDLNTMTAFLGDLHEPLTASRHVAPGDGPHLEAYCLKDPVSFRDGQLLQEAKLIAVRIKRFLASNTMIHDAGGERPVEPGDIAVIARTKAPLQVYAAVLEQAGVPAVLAETDDLLATREAQDGMMLLRFLADPHDDLAVMALLRSPMFAVRDDALQTLAATKTKEQSWFELLSTASNEAFQTARNVLIELANKRKQLPTALFDIAEKHTAYPAIISHLPNGERRLADYRAFTDLVRRLEADTHNAFSVWRDIKTIMQQDINLPRPPVTTSNAVTLINAHKAKGLEWPVVIAADLAHKFRQTSDALYFSAELGFALKLDAETPTKTNPVLYEALKQAKRTAELAEQKRLLYVTLTRARDYLVLTSASEADEAHTCAYNLLNTPFTPIAEQTLNSSLGWGAGLVNSGS